MTTVLAAAQDVGGANALVPVIERLRRYTQVRVAVLARGNAAGVFSAAGIDHRAVDDPADFGPGLDETVCRTLSEMTPDVLLLGTAWGPSIDKVLLAASQRAGVPSLSVLDMWSNYRERFSDPASGEVMLPTKVAVMDDVAFAEALEAGLPRDRLVITGQPHLEVVSRGFQASDVAHQAASLRQAWLDGSGYGEGSRLVLFVSEAIARDFGPDTPYHRGYTEVDALEGAVEAVKLAEQRGQLRARLIVKLHPEESVESFHLGPLARENVVLLVADQPAWPCIRAATLTVSPKTSVSSTRALPVLMPILR